MISFAYISPAEMKRLNIFPGIMTVDTVFGPNNHQISKTLRPRCQVVTPGGDLQEYSQFDNAITKY